MTDPNEPPNPETPEQPAGDSTDWTPPPGHSWNPPPAEGPVWAPPPPPNQPGWRDPGDTRQLPADPTGQIGDPNAWAAPPAYGPPPQGPPAQGPPPQGAYGYWNPPPPQGPGWGQPGPPPAGWGGTWGGSPPWGQIPHRHGPWYGWHQTAGPRRSIPNAVTILLLVVAVLVGMGIGHGVWHNSQPASSNGSQPGNGSGSGGNGTGPFGNNGQGGNSGNGQGSNGALGAASTVSNELVDINVNLGYSQNQAEGTGIVLNSTGLVLTNNHVIAGATQITARDVGNNRQYTATVVGYDRSHDVALLQLGNASGLKFVEIGDSDKVSPGDSVVGIGNAGGLNGAPSTAPGTVTALDQSITAQDESMNTSEKLSGLIETNCDIQPGDSGGALINAAGQVVGVDTAASVGFSFATQGNQGYTIPINQAMQIVSQIQSGQGNQTVHIGQTAFLGVEVEASTGGSGAQVQKAIPGDPAAAAGITANDIITALGGSPVTSPDSLTQLIGRYHPGDRVSVTWQDSTGASHTATVTMGNGPAQ